MFLPAPAALICLFYSAWQPNSHFVLLFLDQATGRWGWRLPSREPSCRLCQSQSLPSSSFDPTVHCMQLYVVCMCLLCILYCTMYTDEHRQIARTSSTAIRLRSVLMRRGAIRQTRCTARHDGAPTLPEARVKHQEQAAVTAMTVSDEVDSCGSTWCSWAGLGWLNGPGGRQCMAEMLR